MQDNIPPPEHDEEGTALPGVTRAAALELAGVVHDVNQLLAVILGRAGLLLRKRDPVAWREQVAAIELAASDAAAILGRLDPRPPAETDRNDPVRLVDAVESCARLITPPGMEAWPEDPQSGWSLVHEVPDSAWSALPGLVVREVLNNLVLNAVEAARGGLRLAIGHRDDPAGHVLSVRDDGPGIAPEVAARLFAARAGAKSGRGRGVGLLASRNLLRRYGGDLRLTETSADGTVFEMLVPAAASAESRVREEAVPAAFAGPDAPRVLVVDDEPAVREMLTEAFAELGAGTLAIGSAEAARDVFEADGFELVLVDQNLSGTQGGDLARELRALDPAVAITLISGWGGEDALSGADPDCVDRTETKPLAWGQLRELLVAGTALSRRRRSEPPTDPAGSGRTE